MNKKIFAALASATMALSATGSLAVFAEDFDVVTEADGTHGTVAGVVIPSSGVAVNEENFPDKNFRGDILNKFSLTYGDKISKTALESVKYIHVAADVKNLTGVEYFTNLVGIDNLRTDSDPTIFTDVAPTYTNTSSFNNGSLVSADLSGNKKLTTINFQNEDDLGTLVVPEGNTLSYVAVTGGTGAYDKAPLTTLDLSKNKLLSFVRVTHTDVRTLDLSNNPYLKTVLVNNNKINTLDLTNNMALETVETSFNKLYSLDVPNTNTLTTLNSEGNVLQEMDLTGLTGLVNLNLVGNELRSLDLSPVTDTLRGLGVANNHLGSIVTKDLKPGSDLYLNLNPQVVYVDSSFDGVNLSESFSDLDSHDVTLDTTGGDISYDKKTGVLNLGGKDEVVYKYNTGLDGSPELQVYVKKESVMNRLYNPNSGEHFYTKDVEEKDALVKLGWLDEGIGWTAPAKSDGNAPVYRLYNPNAGDHHYTKSSSERDILVSVGWKYEGIGWYSYDEVQSAGSSKIAAVDVVREYNPNAKAAGAHNYTVNYAENDFLVSVGWLDEGIAWQAMK